MEKRKNKVGSVGALLEGAPDEYFDYVEQLVCGRTHPMRKRKGAA